jgi:hypothetical protein
MNVFHRRFCLLTCGHRFGYADSNLKGGDRAYGGERPSSSAQSITPETVSPAPIGLTWPLGGCGSLPSIVTVYPRLPIGFSCPWAVQPHAHSHVFLYGESRMISRIYSKYAGAHENDPTAHGAAHRVHRRCAHAPDLPRVGRTGRAAGGNVRSGGAVGDCDDCV